MNMYSPGYTGVGFSRYQPFGTVERVSISLVVHGNEVHHQDVLGCRVQAEQSHLKCGEHPSGAGNNEIYTWFKPSKLEKQL